MVYGAISGTAFGVLENISYALSGGLGTAILRSFLTVPLHASTGVMIGANLVSYRFTPARLATSPLADKRDPESTERDDRSDSGDRGGGGGGAATTQVVALAPVAAREKPTSSSASSSGLGRSESLQQLSGPGAACSLTWWQEQLSSVAKSVWAPVLLHGTYDVLLFVAAGECGPWAWLLLPAYLGVVCQGFYIRWRVYSVEREYPTDDSHDVHAKIRSGEVAKPCICCTCCCGACVCCLCCESCY